MRLYPPFNVTKIKIVNNELFDKYLDNIISTHGTGQGKRMKGKINSSGFLIKKNTFYQNSGRPFIRGKFNTLDKDEMLIYLETSNFVPMLVSIFLIIILIMGIIEKSIFAIPACIVTVIFFYFGNWIFHLVDLKQSKIELALLINDAQREKLIIVLKD